MSEENVNVSIEVVVSWAGNPLASELLTDRGLSIGPGAGSWMALPSELLARDHALVERSEDGWTLIVPAGAEVRTEAEPTANGAERRVRLERGVTASVALGDFSFFVRASGREEAPTRRRKSVAWTRWLAVAAILHGLVLGMFAMSPPDAAALNVNGLQNDTRYVSMSLAGLATPPPPPSETPAGDGAGSTSAPAGEAGGGEQTVATTEASSPGPRRDHGAFSPTPTPTADNLNQLGALAALAANPMSFGDNSSPYTAGSAQDGPGGLANAQLLGLPHGPGWGALDMNSTGHGTCDPRRQDCGSGLIGVDGLDTRDNGPDTGHDFGWSDPVHHVPTVRIVSVEPVGELSREQIRRTVRRHINEVRFCYEQQLQSRPDLEGRVAVRFIISPTGAVQSTQVASNTVGSSAVAGCVEQAVGRWTFPSSAGVTGVTYPFVMQSSH